MSPGARIRTVSPAASRVAATAVAFVCAATLARAQQRVFDATTIADIAAGAMEPSSACKAGATNAQGGEHTTVGDLMPLPGQAAQPGARHWYAAGSMGAALDHTTANGEDATNRARGRLSGRLSYASCPVEVRLTAAGVTPIAGTVTAEGRWNLAPGRAAAPALELGVGAFSASASATDLRPDQNVTLRVAASTANLYDYTLGPVLRAVFGEGYPRLDVRARPWMGAAVLLQDDRLGPHRAPFPEIGGVLPVRLLHWPVSIVTEAAWALHDLPRGQPRRRHSVSLAVRLPSARRSVWVVARTTHRVEAGRSVTAYTLDLVALHLGKD